MSIDLFEQLAEQEVPPVPQTLSRGVHRRLNRALLVLHVVEFVLCALPYALVHFGRAVRGLFVQSISGRYPDDGDKPKA
jgi:hypothetical protein